MSEVVVKDRTKETSTYVLKLSAEKMEEFVQEVTEVSKEEAPFITGNLRRSLNYKKTGPLEHTVFTQTGYGYYVHEGTVRQNPNPFFYRAIERVKPSFNSSGPWA